MPADLMAAVITLQTLHGLSDGETVEAVTFDLRRVARNRLGLFVQVVWIVTDVRAPAGHGGTGDGVGLSGRYVGVKIADHQVSQRYSVTTDVFGLTAPGLWMGVVFARRLRCSREG